MNSCKICGFNLAQSEEDELDFEIAAAYNDGLCWNCWCKRAYGNNANNIKDITKIKNIDKISNYSNIITTIEYLLICMECQHQTGYAYLWFAIQDGREHVLTSRHKLVTISEIVWEKDKALEIIRIDIKLLV